MTAFRFIENLGELTRQATSPTIFRKYLMESILFKIAPELQEEKMIANTMERIAEINELVDKE